ncbi:sulfotransferase [Flexistipes sinusarabici DSM 4947]|uniref:Sulfotransferase n=1 Tax=Flexistipes sinusarabici (strain ATCC 49648 / DSM 4947 / MAS 10) TaxID=717231 RepID=F8E8L3_FLESM|nr:sulfotransferase [Flexistipes sinusarabici]AEI14062.1 sulfotransferase [Flexistipes sinusarabici DSM 4947]
MKSPIFLFSLPRAGSTLLQRVLMTHSEIASVAEPWLMLPFCYAYKREGVLTEYSNGTCSSAFEDFINNLPCKDNDYYEALRRFSFDLYEKQCLNNEKYFLDKTPRYYNIIPEIAKTFPDAKFIFLFRNPVHVMSSMMQTWSGGTLKKLYGYERDLNYGPKALSDGYELLKEKAYAIRYEEYVKNPEKHTKEICDYLEIEFTDTMLNTFSSQDTKGRMGDPTGVKKYKNISADSLDKWKNTFDNKYRKKIIYNYVSPIDTNVLEIQGYKKHEILEEIKSLNVKNNFALKDRFDVVYSYLIRILKPNVWFGKTTKKWARKRYLS